MLSLTKLNTIGIDISATFNINLSIDILIGHIKTYFYSPTPVHEGIQMGFLLPRGPAKEPLLYSIGRKIPIYIGAKNPSAGLK